MENRRRIFKLRKSRFFFSSILVNIGFLACGHAVAAADLLAGAKVANPHIIEHRYEDRLIESIKLIREGKIEQATAQVKLVIADRPDFKLAQLIYADLLLSKARGIQDFGNMYSAPMEKISALLNEAKVRWQHHENPPNKNFIPSSLIRLSGHQKYAIVVDLKASRLYLYENSEGIPILHSDYYVTIGKNGVGKFIEGDQKTPTGVYFVTDYIDSKELPDLYGDGAFPIDYPNAWDLRLNRTGYGIWLHGTPSNTYTRPPRDSNGCVIVSNDDFREISQYIDVNATPVILSPGIDWITMHAWEKRSNQYSNFLEQWRKDWESRDAEKYLSHYSKQYYGLGNDYESWAEYKRQVNPSKQFIQVELYNTSMFLYPGDEKLLVVTFEQDYKSDNFKRRFIKRQYWKMEADGKWRIVYEGNVS